MCDVGKALSRAFTPGGTPQNNFQPSGITNPTGTNISANGNVSQSPVLAGNIAQLQSTFGQEASDIATLRGTVTPGMSQLRQAGLNAIDTQYQSTLSTLQQSLAQRRILGSSFANSQISQLQAQEAQDKANFEASSYLTELQANFNLLQAQYTAQTNQYTTAISQSNIDSALAAQLTASNNQISAQIATANAQLQAQAQAGAGKALGTALGAAASIGLAPFTGGATLAALPGVLSGVSNPSGASPNAPITFTNPFSIGSTSGVFNSGAPAISNYSGSSLFGRNFSQNNATLQ